jgi:CRP-like cAMP-binding protein
MTKNETMYDVVNNLLIEYATMVCAVAETPSTTLAVHKTKFQTVLHLRDAYRSAIMDMIEKKMVKTVQASQN